MVVESAAGATERADGEEEERQTGHADADGEDDGEGVEGVVEVVELVLEVLVEAEVGEGGDFKR